MTKIGKKPKVFGTGLIALDLVMGIDKKSAIRAWAGGTCGNVLLILAYLGWDAFPIARMNTDPASERVKDDMRRWGVHLDFASCSPTCHTPIVIQQIRIGRDGVPTHRFSWSCPQCGRWLPGFKAVTLSAIDVVAPKLAGTTVFFMDRLSRSTLTLAARASAKDAVVVFEPSGRSDERLFSEALELAHIVKYSDERMRIADRAMQSGTATLVEIQTLGPRGLRYRHRLGRKLSDWLHLDAVKAPRLADTCGSGDWCTAGILSRAAAGGQLGLRDGGADALLQALQYGQALAAWNCGFEGARGGMYALNRATFHDQIKGLLEGRPRDLRREVELRPGPSIPCPACPPQRSRGGKSRTAAAGIAKRAA
jgi:sugar/nucleoside kinase (ribokinase family)